jgi:hypothetical protein
MHKTLLTSLAATVFAAAMGFGGNAAAAALYPTTPCTDENQGEITTVDYWNPRTGYWARMYQCDSGSWQLVGYCDQNGCIYY